MKSGSPKKRTKKRKAKTAPKRPQPDRGLTANGRRIHNAMKAAGAKGSWKDHVMFVGPAMIDAWGTYQFKRSDTEAEVEVTKTVFVLHKRLLHTVIGEANAALFWSRKLRRRTGYGRPPGGLRRG